MAEKQSKEAAPLTEELLKNKEADLKTKSEKLDRDIAEFEDFQENVFKEKENLAKEKEAFDADKLSFLKDKEEYEKSKELLKESKLIIDFDFEGENYSFSDKAPEIINFAGQKFSRQELIDNEDVLLQFIGGRSNLIIKK